MRCNVNGRPFATSKTLPGMASELQPKARNQCWTKVCFIFLGAI
jgi:hypothetical protein